MLPSAPALQVGRAPIVYDANTIGAVNVCVAENVCARLVSAIVPVFAGSVAVTVPSAPVVGCKVIVPDVAFLNATEPTVVPATPTVNEFSNVAGVLKTLSDVELKIVIPVVAFPTV